MENNELEQLFEAKRTTEANHRRQEELRRMLEKRNRRPLWPVWTGAIAAGIAVVLITLPVLFRTESVTPLQVAKTEVPINVEEPLEQIESAPTKASRIYRKTMKKTEEIEETETSNIIDNISTIGTIMTTEPDTPVEETSTEPAVRVHRRTSTRMVNAPVAPQRHPSEIGQLLADVFGSEESQPIVLHTITL